MAKQKSIETYNRILESARILFYEQGYEKTTIRQITKNANMQNQASFYQYYENKLDIVNRLSENFLRNVMDFAQLYIDEEDPLIRFLVVQMIVVPKLILNIKNSIYYSEFEKYTTFKFFDTNNNINYKNLFLAVYQKYKSKIDPQEFDFLVSAYASTLGKTIININTGCFQFSREKAVMYMQYFFPLLVGTPLGVLNKKYTEAKNSYVQLQQDEIEKIRVLV